MPLLAKRSRTFRAETSAGFPEVNRDSIRGTIRRAPCSRRLRFPDGRRPDICELCHTERRFILAVGWKDSSVIEFCTRRNREKRLMIPQHVLDNLGPEQRVAILSRDGELHFLVHLATDGPAHIQEYADRDKSQIVTTHMHDKAAILALVAGRERDVGGEG